MHPPYSLGQIAQILSASWQQKVNPDAVVTHLVFDSRQVAAPGRSLFFALSGPRADGHDFIDVAYAVGIRCFVVARKVKAAHQWPEANMIQVSDVLAALQQLAAYHRTQFQVPVVGITGSNGKTIVKEWLYQLLQHRFNIVRSPRSYNSQIGVPVSVWAFQPTHNLAIFEAGISEPGEMARLGGIIKPTLGVFTNIGPAHREGFPSNAAKIEEKMRLFDHTLALVYCDDHKAVAIAVKAWEIENSDRKAWSWRIKGKVWRLNDDPTTDFNLPPDLPFDDPASLENMGHCLAIASLLGIKPVKLKSRLRRLEPVAMRLEVKAGINRCTIVDDAYSNDLAALQLALPFARRHAQGRKQTLILSDILESGAKPAQLYREVAQLIVAHRVHRVLGVGNAVAVLKKYLPAELEFGHWPDTRTFLQQIGQLDFHDEVILLKGARAFTFEHIARRLEQKAHKTVLEINQSALIHNLKAYTRLLHPGTKVLAMVKAAAYGSGPAEVAKLLEFQRVDYLGVAYIDEGIELRQAGIKLPILVLNPEPSGFDALYRYRLEPEVYSFSQLDNLIAFAGRDRQLAIHLKLDTGMHRLGFEVADLPALLERLRNTPNLRVQTAFTHLSASDNPVHDDFTHWQAANFSAMFAVLREGLGYAPIRHIVNTNGIARFPAYHFDMVRLGIGLYGVGDEKLGLRTVLTLKATVSQVKRVAAGDTVGYNRNGPVAKDSTIATISIGYADGFLRLAGNGRYEVRVRGQLAPTIGNVCMDMTMIDVSHISGVREGDEVVVFGEDLPVTALAQCLQTIPYEIFTNIANRVRRVYYEE
jgi:Alr-MurF fusion protein